jgi:hypothetical protein
MTAMWKITAKARVRYVAAAFGAVLIASLWASESARAQGAQDAESACRPDVFRLCSQFIPNSGPITQCLKRNARNLSPECRTAFAGHGKRKVSRRARHHRHYRRHRR